MNDSTPSGRPRSKSLVRVDLENAYAKLGVSPLMTTEEIKRVAEQKRRELMRKRRTRSHQQFGAEEAEITELQQIEDLIGTPRARENYNQANPQNELLTVQPAPNDRWLDPRRRDGLITAWLVEELGQAVMLPSPESLALWAPNGTSPELAALLQMFATAPPSGSDATPDGNAETPSLLTLADLGRLSDSDTPADAPREDTTDA